MVGTILDFDRLERRVPGSSGSLGGPTADISSGLFGGHCPGLQTSLLAFFRQLGVEFGAHEQSE
jgi:hypothetical protein